MPVDGIVSHRLTLDDAPFRTERTDPFCFVGRVDPELGERRLIQRGDDQQHEVGPGGPRLEHLVGLRDEGLDDPENEQC